MGAMSRIKLVVPLLLVLFAAACETTTVRPGEAAIPEDARVTHRAVFIGKTYHDTVGTVSLYQSEQYPVIVFEPNFKLPGANDAKVALGRKGYRRGTSLGKLLRNAGRQAYAVPKHLAIDHFNEVWLWHDGKNIAIGLARLTPI